MITLPVQHNYYGCDKITKYFFRKNQIFKKVKNQTKFRKSRFFEKKHKFFRKKRFFKNVKNRTKFRKSTSEIDIRGSKRPKNTKYRDSNLQTFQKTKNYWNRLTEPKVTSYQTLPLSGGESPPILTISYWKSSSNLRSQLICLLLTNISWNHKHFGDAEQAH